MHNQSQPNNTQEVALRHLKSWVAGMARVRRLEDEKNSSIPASQHSRIPIIALTAYAMLGDREKFLEAGMNDYLGKPVRMQDLAKVLEGVVSTGKA